jgi:hypothetical protein
VPTRILIVRLRTTSHGVFFSNNFLFVEDRKAKESPLYESNICPLLRSCKGLFGFCLDITLRALVKWHVTFSTKGLIIRHVARISWKNAPQQCFGTYHDVGGAGIIQLILRLDTGLFAGVQFPIRERASTKLRPALGPTQSPVQWVSGINRSRRDAHHTTPFSAEIKNGGAILSLPHTSSWRRA